MQAYLDRGYLAERPFGTHGLRASLHAATTREGGAQVYMREFIETVRRTAEKQFPGILLL